MEINHYQQEAIRTAIYPDNMRVTYPTLGLAGEAGEVAEKVKKVHRDHGGFFDPIAKQALRKEIGDVLWYCAALASDLGFTLQEVAEANLEKLRARREKNLISGEGDNREE